MGVLLKGILVAALVAVAAAGSVEWRELHAPEHHVHAVKCAKVSSHARTQRMKPTFNSGYFTARLLFAWDMVGKEQIGRLR